jgi:lipopolysaccharide/colanic/teichoic acid biosynthesis glycosyltransferase
MRTRRIGLWVIDVFLVLCASVAANELRNSYGFSFNSYIRLLPYLCFTLFAWSVSSILFQTSRTIWRFSSLSEYLQIVWACVGTALAAAGLAVMYNRMEGVARSLPILQCIVMIAALVGARVLTRLHHARRSLPQQLQTFEVRQTRKTILLMGFGPLCDLYLRSVTELGDNRIHVAGLLGRNEGQTGRFLQNVPVLGTPENVLPILRDLNVHGVFIDEVVVAAARQSLSISTRDALVELNQSTTISIRFLADDLGFTESVLSPSREPARVASLMEARSSGDQLTLSEVEAIGRRRYWAVKRSIDIVISSALLLALSPLMLAVATVIALDLGMPVTFWQRRPGLGGRPFRCMKFRTMRKAYDGHGRTIPEAERMSTIGRVLRGLRLDELPQLLNILNGDMSLVGPRPLLPVDQPVCARDRLLVRPGMTGWAQVCGGRTISPADKSALDIWYIRHASWRLDLWIFYKTITVIFGGERVDERALELARQPVDSAGSDTPPLTASGLTEMRGGPAVVRSSGV